MPGEDAALVVEVVVQPVDAGIDQADHVLRAGWLGLALVLGRVQFPHQLRGIALRQPAVPQLQRDVAGAGAHAGAVHEAERRLERHDDHRAGRRGVEPGDERLIDPAAGQGHAVGDGAEDIGDF